MQPWLAVALAGTMLLTFLETAPLSHLSSVIFPALQSTGRFLPMCFTREAMAMCSLPSWLSRWSSWLVRFTESRRHRGLRETSSSPSLPWLLEPAGARPYSLGIRIPAGRSLDAFMGRAWGQGGWASFSRCLSAGHGPVEGMQGSSANAKGTHLAQSALESTGDNHATIHYFKTNTIWSVDLHGSVKLAPLKERLARAQHVTSPRAGMLLGRALQSLPLAPGWPHRHSCSLSSAGLQPELALVRLAPTGALCAGTQSLPWPPGTVHTVLPIFYRKRLRVREAEAFAQGHLFTLAELNPVQTALTSKPCSSSAASP